MDILDFLAHRPTPDETPQPQAAQGSTGINWPVVVGVVVAVGLILTRSKATPAPPSTMSSICIFGPPVAAIPPQKARTDWFYASQTPQGQDTPAQPSKAPLWIAASLAALYTGKKLLDYLGTSKPPKTPAQAPTPQKPGPGFASFQQGPGNDFKILNFDLGRLTAPSPPTPQALPTYTPPVDARWLTLAPHPAVILVLGKRGSGKSALGYRLLELFRARATPYVVGMPQEARKLLPDWVGCADLLEDVPPKAVVLLDESYIQYHARNSMSDEGRTIGQMVNLSRQKEQTLIFIVQEARQLDVNAISQADVIAVKELSEISREFERRELKRFTDKARVAFVGVKGNRQRWTWVYSEAAGEVGLVENELATFWKPALSRAFAKPAPDQASNGTGQRKGAKTPREELKDRARALRQQGHSFGEIGRILGISKTQAFNLVNEPDSPSEG